MRIISIHEYKGSLCHEDIDLIRLIPHVCGVETPHVYEGETLHVYRSETLHELEYKTQHEVVIHHEP